MTATLKVLREGGIILYPTDTVWGLGCDATNPEAVAKIYEIKHRADSKALVLLASDMDMICKFVKEIPDAAIQLVEVNDKPTQWASERTGRRRDPDPEQCVFSESCGGLGGDP